MLSVEQLDARTRSIGASEIAAICGIDPWRTPLDVWMKKRRGPNLELEPLKPPAAEKRRALSPATVGNCLESGLVKLYELATGRETVRSGTLVHPKHRWASATPDRFVRGRPRIGLEAKLVGDFMADMWPDEGVPPFVRAQIQWSMFVARKKRWDVVACLSGTLPRIHEELRDLPYIESMASIAEAFWIDHVLRDEPPADTPEQVFAVARQRWKIDNGEIVPCALEAEELAARLAVANAEAKIWKDAKKQLETQLCDMCGPNKGIAGEFGSFLWPTKRGSVSWRDVAEELAGGKVDDELAEKHRAAPYRGIQFKLRKR